MPVLLAVLRAEVRAFTRGKGRIDVHEEDDLVHRLVTRLLDEDQRVIKNFDPQLGSARAYFGRYAHRRLLDVVRTVQRRSELAPLEGDDQVQDVPSSEPSPELVAIRENLNARVHQYVRNKFNARDVLIFEEAILNDRSNQEVGTQLEMSKEQVATRKNVIKSAIRRFLEQLED